MTWFLGNGNDLERCFADKEEEEIIIKKKKCHAQSIRHRVVEKQVKLFFRLFSNLQNSAKGGHAAAVAVL